MRPHEEFDLRDLCGIRGRSTGTGLAAADVGLPGIGDRVYQDMVRRYRVLVKSLVVTSSTSYHGRPAR